MYYVCMYIFISPCTVSLILMILDVFFCCSFDTIFLLPSTGIVESELVCAGLLHKIRHTHTLSLTLPSLTLFDCSVLGEPLKLQPLNKNLQTHAFNFLFSHTQTCFFCAGYIFAKVIFHHTKCAFGRNFDKDETNRERGMENGFLKRREWKIVVFHACMYVCVVVVMLWILSTQFSSFLYTEEFLECVKSCNAKFPLCSLYAKPIVRQRGLTVVYYNLLCWFFLFILYFIELLCRNMLANRNLFRTHQMVRNERIN